MEAVIRQLAPIIQGWTRYYSIASCAGHFSFMSKLTWQVLWKWAVNKHKSAKKARKECFSVKGKGWAFGKYIKGKPYTLKRHDQTKVRAYIKIKAGASIYDGKISYFAERMSYHNARIRRLISLMKSQKFSCSWCKAKFKPDDIIELHHVLDDLGMRTTKLEFQHKHCHDQVHGKSIK